LVISVTATDLALSSSSRIGTSELLLREHEVHSIEGEAKAPAEEW
jgi:hypothetical protein